MTFSTCEIVLRLLHLLSLSFFSVFSVFSFSFSLFFNAEYSRLIEFSQAFGERACRRYLRTPAATETIAHRLAQDD
jgi:hypothetical protein